MAILLVSVLTGGWIEPAHGQRHKHSRSKTSKAAMQKAVAVYSCPLHPEVTAKRAGKCPKCDMASRLTKTDQQPAKSSSSAANTDSEGSRPAIPDVELLDQNGKTVRFYSDLVRNRVVAINFIFTTCTTICPPLGATFARVQRDLGERVGRDVSFISISVDPTTDTPERLKAWGAKFRAGAGWAFVTGKKPAVDELLRALGAASASPQDHSPSILIVDDARGRWTRTYGLAPPSQLVKLINDVVEGRIDMQQQSQQ